MISVIFKFFEYFNDDVVKIRSDSEQALIQRVRGIKNSMRSNDINRIVSFCQTVIENKEEFNVDAVAGAIDVIADLIDWNTVESFKSVMPLIEPLLEN